MSSASASFPCFCFENISHSCEVMISRWPVNTHTMRLVKTSPTLFLGSPVCTGSTPGPPHPPLPLPLPCRTSGYIILSTHPTNTQSLTLSTRVPVDRVALKDAAVLLLAKLTQWMADGLKVMNRDSNKTLPHGGEWLFCFLSLSLNPPLSGSSVVIAFG